MRSPGIQLSGSLAILVKYLGVYIIQSPGSGHLEAAKPHSPNLGNAVYLGDKVSKSIKAYAQYVKDTLCL